MDSPSVVYVRSELAESLPAPSSQRGLVHWLRTNLFATPADTVLTLICLLILAYAIPPMINWLFIDAQWTGTDRTFCTTVAQGGMHPDGWGGACWAFVRAKFGQFMFNVYPVEERWRVVLCGVMLVALLVPFLMPRAPYKLLNAVLLFGVLPIVGFMLLLGAALPFGIVGLAALIVNVAISAIAVVLKVILLIPAVFFQGIGLLGDMVGLPDAFQSFTGAISDFFAGIGFYLAWPFDALSGAVASLRSRTEGWFGATRSLWADIAITAVVVLGLIRWMGGSSRTLALTAAAIAAAAWAVWYLGLDVGLRYVPTRDWGGFMVTIILSYVGIVVSLPMGIVLALGRRSRLPVVKLVCVIFIEMIRGVPLITVLFMATKMLPLFMPNNMKIDDFLCVLIGVSVFASAYMAEVIRGGLQAMPRGQYEGADSLGLGYGQKMRLIILPQALKLVIPGIVNTFIGLFKDTSLVYIINMFDLLGAIRRNFSDANWISPQTPMTGLIFAGFVFWCFCFGMSRYSAYMERRLDTGHKR